MYILKKIIKKNPSLYFYNNRIFKKIIKNNFIKKKF